MITRRLNRQFGRPLTLLALVMFAGTVGYLWIVPAADPLAAVYMTFITISTIGYAEVIDLAAHPGGRVFTMFLAAAGIGVLAYLLSSLTAFVIEGELNATLRRRRMLKSIAALSGHYIVCGIGRVGSNVVRELAVTGRPFVAIEPDRARIDDSLERNPDLVHIHGDATEDDTLAAAGLARAAGVFAVTGNDASNLVITLSVKNLNPSVRVVARCHEVGYIDKIRKVGADAIVSPDFTGGMRIASSMVRPHVVGFLDEMLREQHNIRLEEVAVPARCAGTPVGALAEQIADGRAGRVLGDVSEAALAAQMRAVIQDSAVLDGKMRGAAELALESWRDRSWSWLQEFLG